MALPRTTPVGAHAHDAELAQNQLDLQALLDAAYSGSLASWGVLGVWVGPTPPASPKTYTQWLADGKTGYWAWIGV